MNTEWAGRYGEIIDALVAHSNCVMRTVNMKMDRGDGVMLSQHEYQVLAFLVQHETEDINMITISTSLMIPKSSLTKISKTLYSYGLVEKYQFVGNKKEIILKATGKGRDIYLNHSRNWSKNYFKPLCDGLSSLTDEELKVFSDALTNFTRGMMGERERKLVLYSEGDS